MTMPKQLTIFDFIPNPYESLEIKQTPKLKALKNLNSGVPYKEGINEATNTSQI